MSVTRLEQPDEDERSTRPALVFGAEEDLNTFRSDADEFVSQAGSASSASKNGNGASVARLTGLAITLGGAILLLFAGYLFGWSDLQATHNQQRLFAAYERSAKVDSISGRVPADGEPAAVLAIPALGIHDIVVEGTSATDLQLGPGIMPSAPFPGTGGEGVIAGRDLTYGGVFGSLSQLRAGASVTVTDYLGTFRYVVSRSFSVKPSRALPVVRSNLGSLALVTSGSALPPSGFFVVEAKLVGNPAHESVHLRSPASASELTLGGDTSAWLPFLGWGLVFVLVLVGTVSAYRRTRQAVLVYLLSTPILLVLALLAFENAARLLPATM
jgi:sortase A